MATCAAVKALQPLHSSTKHCLNAWLPECMVDTKPQIKVETVLRCVRTKKPEPRLTELHDVPHANSTVCLCLSMSDVSMTCHISTCRTSTEHCTAANIVPLPDGAKHCTKPGGRRPQGAKHCTSSIFARCGKHVSWSWGYLGRIFSHFARNNSTAQPRFFWHTIESPTKWPVWYNV